MLMSIADSISGKPPSHYKEVLHWKITEKANHIVGMNLLQIPLALVFGIGLFIFVRMFGRPPKIMWSGTETLTFIAGIFIVIALHEFVHAVAMHAFGAKPRYGFWGKGLMFYAKAPGFAFKRNQYVIILLSPLISLSVLACFGILLQSGTSMVWLLALWAIINASAAGGDLWITAIVLRYSSLAYVVDERDGMRIFLPPNAAS
jgi:Putative zincin peptidase